MSALTDEYRTIVSQAGWIERRDRGHIRFTGRDVLTFLQALVTNDVSGLRAEGAGVAAAYLTPQGRMIGNLLLHGTADGVLASTGAAEAAALASRFGDLVFAEDVHVADVSPHTLELMIVGGAAPDVIAAHASIDAVLLRALPEPCHVSGDGLMVVRSGEARVPAFSVIGPRTRAEELRQALVRSGVPELSTALVEALRIDAGRPAFGVDMTTETIPLEAGLLERAISTSKGCYVGQEIIIRILHRGGGRVAKRLVTVRLDGDDPLLAGTTLEDDGRVVGTLTSVSASPVAAETIGLASVLREAADVGRTFSVGGHPDRRAVVTGLAR